MKKKFKFKTNFLVQSYFSFVFKTAVKNTAILAMADFDFILEVRNPHTSILDLNKEISEILKVAKFRFCYGDGKMQAWLTLDVMNRNILFDVVIKFPNDARF